MQPIIIFEGIASSGKTTIEKLLQEEMKDLVFISEGTTLMPLIENTDKNIAIRHIQKITDEIQKNPIQ